MHRPVTASRLARIGVVAMALASALTACGGGASTSRYASGTVCEQFNKLSPDRQDALVTDHANRHGMRADLLPKVQEYCARSERTDDYVDQVMRDVLGDERDSAAQSDDGQSAADASGDTEQQYEDQENADAAGQAAASHTAYLIAKVAGGYQANFRFEVSAPMHVGATGLPADELTAACRRPAERASLVKVNYTLSNGSSIPEDVSLDLATDLSGSNVPMLLAMFSGSSTWSCRGPGDYPGAGISWSSVKAGAPQVGEFWFYVTEAVTPNDPDGANAAAAVITKVSINGNYTLSEVRPTGDGWLGCGTGYLELRVSGSPGC